MIDIVKSKGEGFVDYMWPQPGAEKPVPKVSFVKGYEQMMVVIPSKL